MSKIPSTITQASVLKLVRKPMPRPGHVIPSAKVKKASKRIKHTRDIDTLPFP